MRNLISVIIALSCSLIGCKSQKAKEVQRTELGYEVVYDSIFTRMPGTLIKLNNLAVWQDPFTSGKFLHIINPETKQETILGNIGPGHKEFTTPIVSRSVDGNLLICDLNSAKQGVILMNTDSLDLTMKGASKTESFTDKIMITPEKVVVLQPNESQPLAIETDNSVVRFGKQPLSLSTEITNNYDCFQGAIFFNPQRNLLVYSTNRFPSFSFYKLSKKGTFELQDEVVPNINYEIVNNELVFPEDIHGGGPDITATKDYIIKIERDKKYDKTTAKGRDFTKLPQTLFLYSYEGELQKIVNMKTPLLRVAGDFSDNMIYAINADPEFKLIRINLDSL